MIHVIGVTILLLIISVCASAISPPTRRPSYNTPNCPLTAQITCSVKASGQSCSNVYVPGVSNQCNTGTLISYQFTYCNINKFQVKLDPTKSVIKSDFANYTFRSYTIPSSTCVPLTFDGVLKHCNVTSYAILMLTGSSPKGIRCYAFQQLSLLPKFLIPSNRPSSKPSKRPMAKPSRKPSRNPTSNPTMKPSRIPRSKAPSRKPSSYPTTTPTIIICNLFPIQRRQQMVNQLSSAGINITFISNTTSPPARALSWLVDSDGLRLCPGDSRLVQRFIMAVFYFSTLGDDTWVMCGRNSLHTCHVNLTIFPNDPIAARYGNATWLSAVDECLWGGLSCNNATGAMDRIEFNSITSNQLGGRLPSEITKLSSLRFIILENCCSASIPIYNAAGYKGISGSLPDDIGSLQGLLILKISYNYIGGTLPRSLYNIPNLKEMNLVFNNLNGLVPSPVAGKEWQKLRYFQVDYNSFLGTIPTLATSTKLMTCTLQGNRFIGTMPQGICNLTTATNNFILKNLWADCNNSSPVTCSCCTRCF